MVTNPIRWTVRDLDVMPDDGGWKRYEIINGDLLVTRAPHIRHQSAAGKIHVRLENWSEETGLGSAFQLYSLYGVQEYWIVNWQLQTLEVYRRSNAQLELVGTLLAKDSLKSPILPGLVILMEKIFL